MRIIAPFSVHDDAFHIGNAKRGAAGGVAGLESNGSVLLSTTNKSQFRGRGATNQGGGVLFSSDGTAYLCANCEFDGTNWNRIDTTKQAWRLLISTSSTQKIFGASAGANPITTWDLANNIPVLKLHRDENVSATVHPNAYTFMQSKDAANGLASLDALSLLKPSQYNFTGDEYDTHTGAATDFYTDYTSGTGSISNSAADHCLLLSVPGDAASMAVRYSKSTWILATVPLITQVMLIPGTWPSGGAIQGCYGYVGNPTQYNPWASGGFGFRHRSASTWEYWNADAGGNINVGSMDAPEQYDILTAVGTTSGINFYKNATLLGIFTTRLMWNPMHNTAGIYSSNTNPAGPYTEKVDRMRCIAYWD